VQINVVGAAGQPRAQFAVTGPDTDFLAGAQERLPAERDEALTTRSRALVNQMEEVFFEGKKTSLAGRGPDASAPAGSRGGPSANRGAGQRRHPRNGPYGHAPRRQAGPECLVAPARP
jgi:hypothetical protein